MIYWLIFIENWILTDLIFVEIQLHVRLFAGDTNLTASYYNRGILAKLENNELVHISND